MLEIQLEPKSRGKWLQGYGYMKYMVLVTQNATANRWMHDKSCSA